MTHELYRARINDTPLLSISAEVPAWAPRPQLPAHWLRWVLAGVLGSMLRDLAK